MTEQPNLGEGEQDESDDVITPDSIDLRSGEDVRSTTSDDAKSPAGSTAPARTIRGVLSVVVSAPSLLLARLCSGLSGISPVTG